MNPTTTTTSATPAKRQVICGPASVPQGSTSISWQRRRSKPKRLRVLPEEDEGSNHGQGDTGGATAAAAEGQKQNDNEEYPSPSPPNTSTEYTVKDAYEFDQAHFLNSMYLRSKSRPLPAISTMLAIASQQQQRQGSSSGKLTPNKTKSESSTASKIPSLNDFIGSLREKIGLEDCSGGDGGDADNDDANDDDNMLNQLSTTLTRGHHRRFRELLLELEREGSYLNDKQRKRQAFRNQRARRRELRKLCDLFKQERDLYATALENFKAHNMDRFLTGFRIPGPASDFVNVSAENAKRWSEQWDDALGGENLVSNYYGPYSQAISLHEAAIQKTFDTIGLDTFNPRIVHRETDGLVKLNANWMERLGQRRRLKPAVVTESPSTFLSQDEMAKSLAFKHDVDIVVTSSTLKILMKHPEDPNTCWKIPTFVVDVGGLESSEKLVLYMEDPLPRISTPRECLSVGIREGLISQAVIDAEAELDPKCTKGKFTYTLIDVPHSTRNHRILVRSCNYLLGEDSEPLILLSQLEYFTEECGMEEFSAYDSAVWLLCKILQNNSRIIIGRVDAISTEVLGVEEKAVADCLTDNDICVSEKNLDSLGYFERNRIDINSSFRVMCAVLSAAQLIEKKIGARYLICFPGQGDVLSSHITATIHKAQNNEANAVISIKKEVDNNGAAVLLTNNVLYSCFNRWQWNFDRFPYTFPIEQD